MHKHTILRAVIAATLLGAVAPATHADQADVNAQIQLLASQVEQLRAEVQALRAAQAGAAVSSAATPAAAVGGAALASTAASPVTATGSGATVAIGADTADTNPSLRAPDASPVTFTGYGEVVYTRPSSDPDAAEADLRRVVLGVGYQFDDRTRLEVEAEWEHAIVSADDEGEAAIEQAYISHELGHDLRLQAGVFLIPMGIINERHEPPTFYGVNRPLTELAIIPTTWREGGLAIGGNTEIGLQWTAGVTTGFNLTKWDPTSVDGIESPLGSIHQEMQLAGASELSVFGSVRYTGVPGLALGASVFTGGAVQGDKSGFPADDARATLWSAHARWTPGDWELTALYAEGGISDTADFNLTLVGNPTLVPERFWGAYGEVAYRGWRFGDVSIEPFVRYEQVNTGAEYASIGAGLTPAALSTLTSTTFGASLRLTPHVVFKADYQDISNADPALGLADAFNLGLGYMY